eukprot:scaffold37286_cov36-Phaeocystis_antarctica.AAC.1
MRLETQTCVRLACCLHQRRVPAGYSPTTFGCCTVREKGSRDNCRPNLDHALWAAYQRPLTPVSEQASLTCSSTSLAQAMPCLIGTQVHRWRGQDGRCASP